MSLLLTKCLHQLLNAGCVGSQSWTYSWVDAHVGQHPHQLHQHVFLLLHARWGCLRPAEGRGGFLWGWRAVSVLVRGVQLQERVHAALDLEELQPSLIAFGCEVPEGEEKSHNKVLWESSGEPCRGQSTAF